MASLCQRGQFKTLPSADSYDVMHKSQTGSQGRTQLVVTYGVILIQYM